MTIKIKFVRHPVEAEFEVGSFAEALGVMQNEESELAQLFGLPLGTQPEQTAGTIIEPGAVEERIATEEASTTTSTRKPRGPNKKAAEASAPPPLPVPGAAPTTVLHGEIVDPLDIPASLQRTAPAAAAAPPPPPLMPSAPPIVPAPPTGVLAGKIIAVLDEKQKCSADAGRGLAEWLAHPAFGLVQKGVTYAEAIDVLRLTPDEKLTLVAGQLGL
jgi:hypothetical protein